MVVRVKLSDSLFPTVRCGAGANEATSFVTDTNLTIGNASVPAGAYQRLRSILDYNNQSYSVHGVSHHEGVAMIPSTKKLVKRCRQGCGRLEGASRERDCGEFPVM